ncbi:MAG: hypothetical protein QM776_14290 [Rhodocyclaceae bacterium]
MTRLLAVFALAVLLTVLIPTKAASPESWLGLPVTFVEDGYGFNPWPAKVIKDIKVHTPDPVTMNKGWVTPDWAAWITGGKTNRIQLEVDEIVAKPSSLLRFGTVDGKTTRKVTSLKFAKLKLLLGNTSISLPAGRMEFAEDGTLKRATIDIEQLVTLEAAPVDGKLVTFFKTGNWKWGVLAGLRFDQVVAQGSISDDTILFDKIGATGLGGSVEGVVSIAVTDGFAVAGDLQLDKMSAHDLLSGFFAGHTVQGTVTAKAKFSAAAKTLEELEKAVVTASGSYSAKSGSIDRFGLLEGIKRPNSGSAGGGLTRFQTLEGTFSGVTGKSAAVSIRRLDGNNLQGSSSFQVSPEGKLQGTVSGSLRLPNGEVKARSMLLGGTVKAPDVVVP